jgi:magnesium transporter
MTSDFVTVNAGATAAEAIALLPNAAREGHFLSYLYMVDLDGRLVGVVSLTAILAADPAIPLVEIARDHFESAGVDTTAAELLESFKKYRVQAIPILDEAERPRGIVLLRGLLFETVRELSE